MKNLQREPLRRMTTPELLRHAAEEARLLAKAEALHLKTELREELRAAKRAGILLGSAAALALCGLAAIFVALGLAVALPPGMGPLLVGLVLLCAGGALGFAGYRAAPKEPVPRSRKRLKEDFTLAREQLA